MLGEPDAFCARVQEGFEDTAVAAVAGEGFGERGVAFEDGDTDRGEVGWGGGGHSNEMWSASDAGSVPAPE